MARIVHDHGRYYKETPSGRHPVANGQALFQEQLAHDLQVAKENRQDSGRADWTSFAKRLALALGVLGFAAALVQWAIDSSLRWLRLRP
jgi:hypothetical protein